MTQMVKRIYICYPVCFISAYTVVSIRTAARLYLEQVQDLDVNNYAIGFLAVVVISLYCRILPPMRGPTSPN